jgi:uncharacterized protein YqeY
MTLEQSQKEKIKAMKEKHILKVEVLSSAIGAIQNAAIAKKCKDNITEELVNEVLLKEKKVLQEQIDTCPEDRVMAMATFITKMEYLDAYCPKLIDDPEAIAFTISELLAAAGIELRKANKGAVMKTIMPHFKGKADMKVVNQVVSEILI